MLQREEVGKQLLDWTRRAGLGARCSKFVGDLMGFVRGMQRGSGRDYSVIKLCVEPTEEQVPWTAVRGIFI